MIETLVENNINPPSALLILDGIEHTMAHIGKKRHITGQELSFGIRELCLSKFGGLSRVVLEHLGYQSTFDFGRMVYKLIELELLNKTDDDSIEEFRDVYDFEQSFNMDKYVESLPIDEDPKNRP